jgi:serine/threonine protein kinase
MYDLMKLAWWYGLGDKMNSTTEERYYNDYDQHAIGEITTRKNPEYSPGLRDLVRKCLHIDIGKRPTSQQLLERTTVGLQEAFSSRQQNTEDPNTLRVYYMGHEINHMPVGDANAAMRRVDWKDLRRDQWADPTWQPLLSGRWAPQVKNGELVTQPTQEGGPKRKVPSLDTTIKRVSQPKIPGVIWKVRSSSSKSDGRGDNRADQNNDAQEETELSKTDRGPNPKLRNTR